MIKSRRLLAMVILSLVASAFSAYGREDFARATGKGCLFCHATPSGGAVTDTGLAYARNGYQYPIPKRILEKSELLRTPIRRVLRLVIWYFHLLAAAILMGTIFYVHVLIGPSKLLTGIPTSEKVLGASCFITLALTGVYLSWTRIDRVEQLVTTSFGSILLIKILIYLVMVSSGVIAITLVHNSMKRHMAARPTDISQMKSADELTQFDGSDGRLGLIAYEGKVYDVTASPKWEQGRHFRKHQAGADLSEAMANAPHGPEVLERVQQVGEIGKQSLGATPTLPTSARIFITMAFANLGLIMLILVCVALWRVGPGFTLAHRGTLATASMDKAQGCVDCHRRETPGIHADWRRSVHSLVGVDCYDCHRAQDDDVDVLASHRAYDATPISMVVSSSDCGGCHPAEVAEYARSKHANTIEIMWKVDHWLHDGMNNSVERTAGCYHCHGTEVQVTAGRPVAGTWPNVGVGRKNPDGSLGSCSSCHTRHRFSIEEARRPEACDQCHLGPDHPQIEIYEESKHGTIYHAEGSEWTWRPDDGVWTAGRDFRAPTCAVCHMSGAPGVPMTHDVTERLAWEAQLPLTIHPSEFTAFPAATDWRKERDKMKRVCRQCHSEAWTDGHFTNYDRVVENYNSLYYEPMKAAMDDLYARGLLDASEYFDEDLEWEFYELWHHEGRRARMGAAMMAPDYSWWHGFYELKHRYRKIRAAYENLVPDSGTVQLPDFPGRFTE